MVDIDFESLPVEKTMGMIWDVEADVFRIRSAKMKKVNTRQGILSLISSVYGPFGFGSPMMLPVKQALLEASITAVQLFTLISMISPIAGINNFFCLSINMADCHGEAILNSCSKVGTRCIK